MRTKLEMSVAKYLRAFWQLARPLTLIVMLLHGVLAYVLLTHDSPDMAKVLLGVCVLLLAYAHAAAINDLSDEEVDKINLKARHEADRPLVNNTASRRQLVVLVVCLTIATLLVAMLLSWWFVVIALIALVFNGVYSLRPFRVSGRGVLAQLLLPVMYVGFPTAITVAIVGTVTLQMIVVMVGAYMVFVGRLFLKDIRDEIGDKQTGKLTYIVRHGLKRTLVQSGVWIVAGSWWMLVALVVGYADMLPLFLALIVSNVMAVWALRRCYHARSLDTKLLYVAMAGRAATLWVFSVIVWSVLVATSLALWQKYSFLALGVAIFFFGIVALYEEISQKRKS